MAAAWRSVFREGLFDGKVAIVTGGGTGIGKAIAAELLSLGSKVVIASRSEGKLQKAAVDLEKFIPPSSSAEVKVIPCNIRKESQVTNLMKSTLSSYGRIDYLVNNGGGQFLCPVSNMSYKGWNAVIDTNLNGTFLCCTEAYRLWMSEHGGSIVNIIVDFFKGYPNMAHTGAARAGVHNLTMSLAVEWISNGIRINNVAPGVIFSETAAANYPIPDLFEKIRQTLPAKRCGETEEVSGAVCFLLSPAASYITGSTIKVDGASSLVIHEALFFYSITDHNNMPLFDDRDDSNPKSKL
ncbi:predicted protein [Nematostella vectensis]|uniref:Peroxisomal trans-2-enoyl-CoA reductase n=1 Tax=Nematostella vectensis TaxID=45351 RepID=A7S1C8_NEMVE|nr:predicted protein [Nematostella vectensis]|eukprot:XP_001634549.1 predicted protein [Nematostella vectensis]